MRLDLYQAECERITRQQRSVLDEVATRLRSGAPLLGCETESCMTT